MPPHCSEGQCVSMNLHFKRARDCSGRGGLLSLPRVGEGWDFSLNSSPLPGEPNMLTAQTAVWEGLGQDQSYFAWVSNKWTVSVYIVSLQCIPPPPSPPTFADDGRLSRAVLISSQGLCKLASSNTASTPSRSVLSVYQFHQAVPVYPFPSAV